MTTAGRCRILLLCYGNPGRMDDGLGPEFARAAERASLPGVDVSADYQLTVEDAKDAAEHDFVIFVDAAIEGDRAFFLEPVVPRNELSFSSHSLEPAHVLALAREVFGQKPSAYSLGIRGYQFDGFGEDLSPDARTNLESALQFMLPVLERGSLAEAAASLAGAAARRAADNGD
jgi:hydrogenase maturation protease